MFAGNCKTVRFFIFQFDFDTCKRPPHRNLCLFHRHVEIHQVMIAHVTTAYKELVSTSVVLRFAERVRKLINHPVINESPDGDLAKRQAKYIEQCTFLLSNFLKSSSHFDDKM